MTVEQNCEKIEHDKKHNEKIMMVYILCDVANIYNVDELIYYKMYDNILRTCERQSILNVNEFAKFANENRDDFNLSIDYTKKYPESKEQYYDKYDDIIAKIDEFKFGEFKLVLLYMVLGAAFLLFASSL